MKVEQAIGIIIGVAIILIFLFYLVTRYFNYRLQKSLQNQNQVYSMVDGLQEQKFQNYYGLQGNIAFSKVQQWEAVDRNQQFQLVEFSERSYLKQSLYQHSDSIYSNLHNSFNNRSVPAIQESNRTAITLRSLDIQKLSNVTNSSFNNSSNPLNNPQQNNKKNNQQQKQHQSLYKYISKIVSYQRKGIQIIQISIQFLYKEKNGQIKCKGLKILKETVSPEDANYLQFLEVYGFQEKAYGAFKYQTCFKIPRMSIGTLYEARTLKFVTNKEEIQLSQFYLFLSKAEDEIQQA